MFLIAGRDIENKPCSCPDWAGMCKHVAATLYGVGNRLDHQPELLFKLRQVDHLELDCLRSCQSNRAKPKTAQEKDDRKPINWLTFESIEIPPPTSAGATSNQLVAQRSHLPNCGCSQEANEAIDPNGSESWGVK